MEQFQMGLAELVREKDARVQQEFRTIPKPD
jgi:hypothetical protein